MTTEKPDLNERLHEMAAEGGTTPDYLPHRLPAGHVCRVSSSNKAELLTVEELFAYIDELEADLLQSSSSSLSPLSFNGTPIPEYTTMVYDGERLRGPRPRRMEEWQERFGSVDDDGLSQRSSPTEENEAYDDGPTYFVHDEELLSSMYSRLPMWKRAKLNELLISLTVDFCSNNARFPMSERDVELYCTRVSGSSKCAANLAA